MDNKKKHAIHVFLSDEVWGLYRAWCALEGMTVTEYTQKLIEAEAMKMKEGLQPGEEMKAEGCRGAAYNY